MKHKTMLGYSNAKTDKSVKEGYLTGILYLAPGKTCAAAGHDIKDVCPFASEECRAACLYKAGRGRFNNVQEARISKTRYLLEGCTINAPKEEAVRSILEDIRRLKVKANNKGLTPCVRLNGTSDLPFHSYGIMDKYPSIQFYDYTKDVNKINEYIAGRLPVNYNLVLSYTGYNIQDCQEALAAGVSIAVVFKGGLPASFLGAPVVDGDQHDLIFKHAGGQVIGLKPKGMKASDLKETNAFIVNAA
ncbi:MAG: GP88 family protein [Candidatus Nezhaarchaeales archaeon]